MTQLGEYNIGLDRTLGSRRLAASADLVAAVAMTALHHFRIAALLEGWSYLILLLIAMPLKYAAGLPLAVRIVGSVHGFLFLTFIMALYRVILERNWPLRRALRGFLYSLAPFGAFVFDRSLVREMASAEGSDRLE